MTIDMYLWSSLADLRSSVADLRSSVAFNLLTKGTHMRLPSIYLNLFVSASLAMSTSVLKALPGKLDIKRHSPSILYVYFDNYTPGTKYIGGIYFLPFL